MLHDSGTAAIQTSYFCHVSKIHKLYYINVFWWDCIRCSTRVCARPAAIQHFYKSQKLSAYTDHKQLFCCNANARIVQRILNSELAVASSRFKDNGLLLNAKKCESLVFRKSNLQRNKAKEDKISFMIDGTPVEPSTTCKLLGVLMDERLNVNNHVALLCQKISKQIAIICPLRKLLSFQTKLTLYKVYILSCFTYCSTVWMNCGKTKLAKLEKLNERDLRSV